MKRKIAFLVLALFLLFNNQALATLDIPAGNYGFILGKYNATTKTFSPSNTTVFQWDISTGNSMWVRTIGPTSVWVDGKKEGTIVSFVDKNSSEDNGYPMVESTQWNAWITLFGGGSNKDFVLKNLKSWYLDDYGKRFANLSQLAELSGGRGLSWDTKTGSIIYGKSTGPTASITPDRYSCKVGESITFNLSATNKAMSYHFVDMTFKDDKGTTYVNNKRFLSDTAYRTVTKTFTAVGNYLFTLTVNDGVFRYTTKQLLISVSNNPVDPVQPPDPLPEAPPEPPAAENLPPTAVYSWPNTCYEGDTVNVSESSFDLDGQVVSRSWAFAPPFVGTSSLGRGGGTLSFNNTGTYDMTLTVTDDDGATDAVTHSIEVKPPVPQAVITYGGALKENRRVVLDSSNSISGTKHPIDHARDEWTVTAVYGGTALDIKLGTRAGAAQDVLFKKAGIYRIGLKVYNSKYASEWTYKDLVINPDIAPAANFFKSAIAFRDPSVNNYAYVTLNDRTFSFDGDFISQRIWKYKFDSDNDGSFLDETWAILDSANNTKVTFRANHVGKYLFELEAKEIFGQETIPAFIVDSDYRRGDTTTKPQTDKITDIQNIAPVTSFTATLKPKVDVFFSQGFLEEYSTRLPNMVNNLEPVTGNKLKAKNTDYAFYNTATAPRPEDLVNTLYSPVGVKEMVIDLGKTVNRDYINDFRVLQRSNVYMKFYVSPDNVNWYFVQDLWNSPFLARWVGFSQIAWDVGTVIDKKTIPIPFFRYTKVTFTYSSSPCYYYQWIFLNKLPEALYVSSSDVFNNDGPETRYVDLGKVIERDSLISWKMFRYSSGSTPYDVYVSNDNINWSYVTTLSFPGYNIENYVQIPKYFVQIPAFRYVRFDFTDLHYITSHIQQIYTATGPRASLSDIQTQANRVGRDGALKYIVSLAEEPYIDADAANLTSTADLLNALNVNFVGFVNAGSTPSVQQLTSKLNKQTIIPTTYDMSVPLSSLADYINSTAVSSTQAGVIKILLGESLGYNPSYSDYENDPKATDNWYYFHDPNYLDNNSGLSFYHNKTISGPVATLDKVGKYDVQYKAQDDPANTDLRFLYYRMWSDPAPSNIIIHRKPIADFSVQAGTVNVTDLSYDPDFQFRRPDKGVVQWLWKWRPAASSAWTNGKPSGITALGTYVVHLEVKDVYGVWSDPVEKTITVATLQRPPVADFNWTPTLIYEGDTVNLNNLSTDPDGDPLAYLWTVFNPLGGTTTFTTKNGTTANVLPGTYWVTLRAADPGGMSDAITKSFVVNPLGLSGSVNHTPEWNAKRISFNQKTTGTDDSPRAYNVFWAGEAFVLQGITTDTATSTTKAQTVTVTFIDRGITINLSPNASRTTWTGEMFEDDFETIADGTYDFRFVATYSNGVVKTVNVPIEISGTWLNYYNFHRSW